MIRVLPPEIVDKIAAGEVIERPASVVKELMENSLDAGARRVDVEVEGGGARLIKVTDDGSGIDPADLVLAFLSHATSKLMRLEDLEEIASLGFRGEALASIGAVSRASLRSRSAGREAGAVVEDHGGAISPVREVGMPPGTVVEVRDLFFNTPARRKFLKSPPSELAHITDVVTRLSLSHPGVRCRLLNDGKLVYAVEADDGVSRRLRLAFGRELGEGLLRGEAHENWGHLELFLGRPEQARRRSRLQLAFVNGRPVRDRTLVAAIRQGYADFLAESLQPVYAVFLAVPPSEVDVNVHPTKSEVRFRRAADLFRGVVAAVGSTLRRSDLAPRPRLSPPRSPAGRPPSRSAGAPGSPLFEEGTPCLRLPAGGESVGEEAAPEFPVEAADRSSALTAGVLQVHCTYIVREVPEGLMVIDQHALHERLVYNRLKRQLEGGQVLSQRLLTPCIVEVPRRQVVALEEAGEMLARLGVDLRPFGEAAVALSAVPALLDRHDPERLVAELLDVASGEDSADASRLLEKALLTLACHRSVRGGERLSEPMIRRLLREADADVLSQTCPHGRPTRVVLPLAEIERLFKRRGS
ncbi:MAG: DNA mismatch repair endonuclease MutL [Planctomycetota bacterium]